MIGLRDVSAQDQPNILIILTDDQRFDDVTPYMPITSAELFDKGAYFPSAYITTPACCPSRASIFTGRYASQHEVIGNPYVLREPTFIEMLKDADIYFTGIVGKYLNTSNGRPRPEFDYWVSFEGGNVSYFNPELNVNGRVRTIRGYSTTIFGKFAQKFLSRAQKQEKPFLLYLSFNAPHYPAKPHPSARNMFTVPTEVPPSFNEADRSDKPAWIRKRDPVSQRFIERMRTRQRQCLWTVDQTIGKILAQLEESGLLENTAIFFLSDNGIFAGEHTLNSKDAVYEEAVRVPFTFRWDKGVDPGERPQLTSNIDIAPTVLDLAGLPILDDMEGKSLLSIAAEDTDPHSLHRHILLEGFRESNARVPFYALHTGRWVYVNSKPQFEGLPVERELYDLENDPHQLENLVSDTDFLLMGQQLQEQLELLVMEKRNTLSFDEPKGIIARALLRRIRRKRRRAANRAGRLRGPSVFRD